MTAIYLAGHAANVLIPSQLTPSSENDLFKAEDYLAVGDPGAIFQFGSATANSNVVADLSRVVNGSFEDDFVDLATGAVPTGWTDASTGSGYPDESSTVPTGGGSSSVRLRSGSTTGRARVEQRIRVMDGWRMTVKATIRGGAGTTSVHVRNLRTGSYLQSGGTWGADAAWHSLTSTSWSAKTTTFTVEDGGVGDTVLLISASTASGTNRNGYADLIFMWPSWDFAALFDSDHPSDVTARLRSDDNSSMSSATNRLAFDSTVPAAWKQRSMVDERYVQLYFDGTPFAPISVGELVVGQKRELPNALLQSVNLRTNTAIVAPGDGRRQPVSLEVLASRDFGIRTVGLGSEGLEQLRSELVAPLRYGGGRLLIVPDSGGTDVFYGFVGPFGEADHGKGLWELDTQFRGYPYAVRVN